MRRIAPRAACALLALLAVVSCGVPDDRRARPIDRELPFGLGSPKPSVQDSGTLEVRTVTVYLVRSDRLVAVRHAAGSGELAQAVVDELLSGPTGSDLRHGLSSAVPPGVQAKVVVSAGGLVRVDVSANLVQVRGEQQLLAIAQVVLTLSVLPSVTAVRFDLDGSAIQVPIGDGTLVDRAVSAADYRNLRA